MNFLKTARPFALCILFALLAACSKPADATSSAPDAKANGPAVQKSATKKELSSSPVRPYIDKSGKPTANNDAQMAEDEEDDDDDVPQLPPEAIIALENEYRTTTSADRKAEIAFQLGDVESDNGVQALQRILFAESDPEQRAQLVMVFSDSFATDEQKLNVFTRYIGNEQPAGVRQASIAGLDDIDDPRAIPIWQRLLGDADADTRETAKSAIQRIQAPKPPEEDDEDE